MKPSNNQFGTREIPASPRQHDSRVAAQSAPVPSAPLSATEQDMVPLLSATPSQESSTSPPNNAAHTAATGGKRQPENHLLTVREVADLLQVPVSWVYEHIRGRCADRLPGFRLGKYWRFTEEDVTEWLRAKRTKDYHHAGHYR